MKLRRKTLILTPSFVLMTRLFSIAVSSVAVFSVAVLSVSALSATAFAKSSGAGNSFRQIMNSARPTWGVEFKTTLSAFGGNALAVEQGIQQTTGFTISAEYQPKALQSLGVLGIGPSFSLFPIFGAGVTPSITSIYSYGGVIRYQAKFFKPQSIVPMIGYTAELLHYHFNSGLAGEFWYQGPILGLYILLNPLERSAANNLFIDFGISRTYLTLEVSRLSGSDESILLGGDTYSFGLRMEF